MPSNPIPKMMTMIIAMICSFIILAYGLFYLYTFVIYKNTTSYFPWSWQIGTSSGSVAMLNFVISLIISNVVFTTALAGLIYQVHFLGFESLTKIEKVLTAESKSQPNPPAVLPPITTSVPQPFLPSEPTPVPISVQAMKPKPSVGRWHLSLRDKPKPIPSDPKLAMATAVPPTQTSPQTPALPTITCKHGWDFEKNGQCLSCLSAYSADPLHPHTGGDWIRLQ